MIKTEKQSFSSFILKLNNILKMIFPMVKKYLSYFQYLTSSAFPYPMPIKKKKRKKDYLVWALGQL